MWLKGVQTAKKQYKDNICSAMYTLVLIVYAHPHCARNSRGNVMPRHALSARPVEEI